MPEPVSRDRLATTGAIVSLLLAAFVVAVGYGVVLPVLPLLLDRITVASDQTNVARQVGFLTAAYTAAPLITAAVWGRLSDRFGRRPIIAIGLLGCSLTLAASAFATTLPLLYAGRVLNGFFSAAVLPAALAFVADVSPGDGWRARRFAWIGMASIIGFVIGPMLGGLAFGWGGDALLGWRAVYTAAPPFLLAAALSLAAVPAVWALLPAGRSLRAETSIQVPVLKVSASPIPRLLILSAAVAGGVSVFEVGTALLGREREMDPVAIGVLFAECSLIMLLAQAVVFSPVVKPALTRWFVAPGFMAMAAGLAAVPLARDYPAMLIVTGLIAASAGVIAPVLIYWISFGAGAAQGAALGRQTAAVSFGQMLGSLAGGSAYTIESPSNAAFLLAVAGLILAAAASVTLPRRLLTNTSSQAARPASDSGNS